MKRNRVKNIALNIIILFILIFVFSFREKTTINNRYLLSDTGNIQKARNEFFERKEIKSDKILKNSEIVINKTKRTLSVYCDSVLAGYYKVAFGLDPLSDKKISGDFSTPEGVFYICNKNPNSKFYLSLLISYPNIEDAERGLRDSIINKNEYNKIIYAINRKTIPPQNTKLGGDICIHGGGTSADWTAGCIALGNEDIEDIFRTIPLGTKVTITK